MVAPIGNSFDIEYAKKNKAYAYQCWNNYNNEGNTMNISAADYGQIVGSWKSEIEDWTKKASQDDNSYEIDEESDEFQGHKERGEEYAKDVSGSDGKADGGGGANVAASGAVAAGAAATAIMTSMKIVQTAKDGAKQATNGGIAAAWIGAAAAVVGAAQTAAVVASKVNKEQADALEKLTTEQQIAQDTLLATQEDMDNAQAEILELADEAASANDDANKEIAGNKSDFDMQKASAERLKAKQDSGKALTPEEQAQLEKYQSQMEKSSGEITDISDEASEAVGAINSDMGAYQEIFDAASATTAEVQGLTDFAAGFDEDTKKNANMMKTAMTLNSAAGAMLTAAGLRVMTKGVTIADKALYMAAGATMIAGGATMGVLSGLEASKQSEYKTKSQTEIEARKLSQDINTTTMNLHDERAGDYQMAIDDVGDLELEMPEDMEIPDYDASKNPVVQAQQNKTATPAQANQNGAPATNSNGGSTSTASASGTQTASSSSADDKVADKNDNKKKKNDEEPIIFI